MDTTWTKNNVLNKEHQMEETEKKIEANVPKFQCRKG